MDEAKSWVLIVSFATFVVISFVVLVSYTDLIDINFIKLLAKFTKNQIYYFNFLLNAGDCEDDEKSVGKIRQFGEDLIFLAKCASAFLIVIFLFTSPIYTLKLLGVGESHVYQYGWLFSLAYMKGEGIAALIVIVWMFLIGVIFGIYLKCDLYRLRVEHGKEVDRRIHDSTSHEDLVSREGAAANDTFDYKLYLQYAFLGSLNLVIVVVVNGAYTYSTYQDLHPSTSFFIQVGLAVFKMIYSLVCVPILTKNVRDQTSNIAVRSMLNLFNNLLIPCITTAFTSPTCFQVCLTS